MIQHLTTNVHFVPYLDLIEKILQQDVKLSKRCQMSKIVTPRLGRRFTKKIDIMRFTDIDINFDVTYDGH